MHPPFPRAALLIRLLIGLWVICWGGEALALPAVAGMCDPVGASAPAPLPVLPIRGGEILPLDDCDRLLAGFGEAEAPADSASVQIGQDAPKPAVPGQFAFPVRAGTIQPIPRIERLPSRMSVLEGVYRPPRC
jgi:hypothetical protein